MSVNFTGLWIADLCQSNLRGARPTAITAKIEHSDPDMDAEIVVIRAGGIEDRTRYSCKTNGERDKSTLNGRPIRGSSFWEGNELVIESWITEGSRELHFCDYWFLSPDGQTLYMEHRNDDLAGQIAILNRVELHIE